MKQIQPFYITKEGLEKLKAELEYLKKVKRLEVAERLKEARSYGDLSENAEYAAAREEQSFVESRILALEDKIKRAKIIEHKESDVVRVGSKVDLEIEGEKESFLIVGPEETDPNSGKISVESPIGKALLGHKEGDEVLVLTPAGRFRYKIIKIS